MHPQAHLLPPPRCFCKTYDAATFLCHSYICLPAQHNFAVNAALMWDKSCPYMCPSCAGSCHASVEPGPTHAPQMVLLSVEREVHTVPILLALRSRTRENWNVYICSQACKRTVPAAHLRHPLASSPRKHTHATLQRTNAPVTYTHGASLAHLRRKLVPFCCHVIHHPQLSHGLRLSRFSCLHVHHVQQGNRAVKHLRPSTATSSICSCASAVCEPKARGEVATVHPGGAVRVCYTQMMQHLQHRQTHLLPRGLLTEYWRGQGPSETRGG